MNIVMDQDQLISRLDALEDRQENLLAQAELLVHWLERRDEDGALCDETGYRAAYALCLQISNRERFQELRRAIDPLSKFQPEHTPARDARNDSRSPALRPVK